GDCAITRIPAISSHPTKGGAMVRAKAPRLHALPMLAAGILTGISFGNSLAFAQGFSASITGVVKDASGAVLPGTAITAKHIETGLTRAALTDAGGGYSLPSLPVGGYELTAEKAGFKLEVRRGVDLVVAQQAVLDLTLQVGNVEQRVTVTADAPLVNT